MKRILLAAIFSTGLHGLLFSMETGWLAGIKPVTSELREIKISLAQLPQKPAIKPSPKLNHSHIHKERLKKQRVKPTDIQKRETPVEPLPKPETENPKPGKETKELNIDPIPDIPQIKYSSTSDQKAKLPATQTIFEARPIYRLNPSPSYPIIARKRGYQGNVILEVLINKQGKVIDLKVFSSSGYSILDKTATASVKKWLFEPGMKGNDKIEMWVRVPIRFKLN
jgi:protein TonB